MDFAHAEPLHYFYTVEFPNLDLRGEVRSIEAPTLVVVGDDDMIAGPACAEAMLHELPNARLVTIPDAGHYVYLEQPEAFRAALTGLLL
jgi:pimeloyl-ACP methyl ester carboxylesterase